jgi:hypothetical protein
MEKGSYQGRHVNFNRYVAACFNPYLFAHPTQALHGCGASALALLTGIAPATIAKGRRGLHWPDACMLRFLHRHGFATIRLTQCNLTRPPLNEVGPRHVLLISQLFALNEGTWIVIFNGRAYHNFEIYQQESLSFLNKPILSAYVVVKPEWRQDSPASPASKSPAVQRPKSQQLNWSHLNKAYGLPR